MTFITDLTPPSPTPLCSASNSFEVRIEAMVLHEEFFPSCAVMSHEIDVVRVATKGNNTQPLLPSYTQKHMLRAGDPDIWAVSGGKQKVGMCHLRYSDVRTEWKEKAVSS